jgi:hypothetical protein
MPRRNARTASQPVKTRLDHVRSREGRDSAVAYGLDHGLSVTWSRDGIVVRPLS